MTNFQDKSFSVGYGGRCVPYWPSDWDGPASQSLEQVTDELERINPHAELEAMLAKIEAYQKEHNGQANHETA